MPLTPSSDEVKLAPKMLCAQPAAGVEGHAASATHHVMAPVQVPRISTLVGVTTLGPSSVARVPGSGAKVLVGLVHWYTSGKFTKAVWSIEAKVPAQLTALSA